MGHTITLNVPDSVYQSLVRRVEQSGQPPESLAVELLASATQPEANDPLEAFIGAFDSQGSDWADRHDAHLGMSAKQRRYLEQLSLRVDVAVLGSEEMWR